MILLYLLLNSVAVRPTHVSGILPPPTRHSLKGHSFGSLQLHGLGGVFPSGGVSCLRILLLCALTVCFMLGETTVTWLKVNYEKTEALWIGPYKSLETAISSSMPILWAKDKVYALGIWFSTSHNLNKQTAKHH